MLYPGGGKHTIRQDGDGSWPITVDWQGRRWWLDLTTVFQSTWVYRPEEGTIA